MTRTDDRIDDTFAVYMSANETTGAPNLNMIRHSEVERRKGHFPLKIFWQLKG